MHCNHLKKALPALFFLCLLSSTSAQSGHFRTAFLSWSKLDGNTVEITLDSSWRYSFTGYLVQLPPAPPLPPSLLPPSTGTIAHINGPTVPLIAFSDGSSSPIAVNISAFSVTEDWFFGTSRFIKTFPTPNNLGSPWRASFSGCCRIASTGVPSFTSFHLSIDIDLTSLSSSFRPLFLPIIRLYSPSPLPQSFHVPAASLLCNQRNAPHLFIRVHNSTLASQRGGTTLLSASFLNATGASPPFLTIPAAAPSGTFVVSFSYSMVESGHPSYSPISSVDMLISITATPLVPLASLSCTPLLQSSSSNQNSNPLVEMQAYAGSPVTLTFCSRVSSPALSSSLLFGTLPAAVNVTTTGSLLSLLDVIVQVAEEPSSSGLLNRGYEKLQLSSNDGAGGDAVFIWILASRSNSSAGISAAITGVSIAVSDAERAAAAAAGYIQLSGNLNSGTGGSLVTLHIIRGSGRVAAGSLNSLEAAFTSSVLFGLVISRQQPPNSTLVAGNLNHGVIGASPLFLYSIAAPTTMTSVAITWKPCVCAVGTHFICLAGSSASTSNSSAPLSYTSPLCARITVLPRLAPNWTTTSSTSLTAFIGRRINIPLTFVLNDPSRSPVIAISSLSPQNVPLSVSATTLLSENLFVPHPHSNAGQGHVLKPSIWGATFTFAPQWDDGGRLVNVCFDAVESASERDPLCSQPSVPQCFAIEVQRCFYVAGKHQTLATVSKIFGTTWHDLFMLNRNIDDPDAGLEEGDVVRIAHTYKAVAGDTISSIAARFSSTSAEVLTLNADIANEASRLKVGQELCVPTSSSCAAKA